MLLLNTIEQIGQQIYGNYASDALQKWQDFKKQEEAKKKGAEEEAKKKGAEEDKKKGRR